MKIIGVLLAGLLLASCSTTGARTAEKRINAGIIRRMTELYNAGSMEEYFSYWTKDVTWEAWIPGSARRSAAGAELRQQVVDWRRLFPDDDITSLQILVDGNQVVRESLVNGTAAIASPPFEVGDRRSARMVTFFTLKDGKVSSMRDHMVPTPGLIPPCGAGEILGEEPRRAMCLLMVPSHPPLRV